MKTSLLQQLSKEITQGEWKVFAGTNIKVNDVSILRCYESSEICGNPTDAFETTRANAKAISLTPQLIREVLELREALRQSGEALASALSCINAEDDSGVAYPKTRSQIADAQATRSLLTRHETTDKTYASHRH